MNVTTTTILLCLIAFASARDAGTTVLEPEVTPTAVEPIIVEAEESEILEALTAPADPSDENIDDINLDEVTVEVTDEKGNPINVRNKRSIGPVGAIVVKLLLKGKIIAHYVFKAVHGFSTGLLHGLIG